MKRGSTQDYLHLRSFPSNNQSQVSGGFSNLSESLNRDAEVVEVYGFKDNLPGVLHVGPFQKVPTYDYVLIWLATYPIRVAVYRKGVQDRVWTATVWSRPGRQEIFEKLYLYESNDFKFMYDVDLPPLEGGINGTISIIRRLRSTIYLSRPEHDMNYISLD